MQSSKHVAFEKQVVESDGWMASNPGRVTPDLPLLQDENNHPFDESFLEAVCRKHPKTESSPPPAVVLPFTVRIARTESHLSQAVRVRWQSYSRTLPDLAEELRAPEPADTADHNIVLVAEDKATGVPVGSMRVETNLGGSHFLDRWFHLPEQFSNRTVAWVTRLAVQSGATGRLAKLAIFKALYRYCLAIQIDWITVGSVPPLDRQYLRLGFQPIFPEGKLVPMPSNPKIPQRMLAFDVVRAEQMWREQNHPFYQFIVRDYCPDILIFSSLSGSWSTPRDRQRPPPPPKSLDDAFGFTIV